MAPLRRYEWADLNVICLKAMQKEPERRYATVDALFMDVHAFLKGDPLSARPDSWLYRAGKFLRRNRKAVLAAAAVFIIINGLSGAFVWRLNRERQAALSEAAHANRLLQFTLNLFDSGQAEAGPPSDLRVTQVLERGALEARTLQKDPLRQSELFMTLGSVFYRMSEYEKAETNLRAALNIRSQLGLPAAALAAQSEIALGLVHSDQARFDEGEKEVRTGLEVLEHLEGPRDPGILEAKVSLGHVLLSRGSYNAAVRILEPVVQMQQLGDSSDVDRASAFYELAVAYQIGGDTARARQSIQSSLLLHLSLYGTVHPSVADDEQWLCELELRRFAFADAERHCRTALSVDQAWYGAHNGDTAVAMRTLGSVLTAENKLAEAKPLLDHALSELAQGNFHEGVATASRDLGTWAYQSGDYSAAEQYYGRSLAIFQEIYGDRDVHVAWMALRLGCVAIKKKNYPRAEALIRHALAIDLETQGPQRTSTGLAHITLGHLLLCEKRFAAARQESQLGYDIAFKESLPEGEFFNMAKKDLAEEDVGLSRPQ